MYHAKFKIFTISPLQKSLPTPILNYMCTVWIEILYIYFCIYLTYTQPLTHMCVNSGCFRVVRLQILYIFFAIFSDGNVFYFVIRNEKNSRKFSHPG